MSPSPPRPRGPLRDARILAPFERPAVHPLAERLRELGATVQRFPPIQPRHPGSWSSLDRALQELASYDWVGFAGAHAVHHWVERADEVGVAPFPDGARWAAIGVDTARTLAGEGHPPDYAPRRHTASAVAQGWPAPRGARVLLVRDEAATDALPRTLATAGAAVDTASAYRIALPWPPTQARSIARTGVDAVALLRPAAVRHLVLGAEQGGVTVEALTEAATVAAAGPVTAHAAGQAGLRVTIVARGGLEPLVDQLVAWWEASPTRRSDHDDLELRAEGFLARWRAADGEERARMVEQGRSLAGDLFRGAMDLSYSRATEFSPLIGRYDTLREQITALLPPEPGETG